ncbi:TlpA disulfide reductase family protein [Pedobacter antarcticus]|uniref:TlpA family protein disulfide reductase n=1 Tax=Pedobacter antarcticus TaxID=34086 RepID=UPI00292D748C|nr:TlpA disulfide reductase family protein [Pedobacter antarcticus]
MKTLSIGDSVPEYFWQLKHHVYHNGKLTVQDLSGYKGKYMILDFWATWCSSCISHFGTLDSLAKANPAKLQIIQVNSIVGTGDTEDKVVSFFKSHVLSMPCIYQDTVLKEMFPRRFLPHYVWINEHGKVDAITSSALINSVNLHSLTASPNTTPNQKEK